MIGCLRETTICVVAKQLVFIYNLRTRYGKVYCKRDVMKREPNFFLWNFDFGIPTPPSKRCRGNILIHGIGLAEFTCSKESFMGMVIQFYLQMVFDIK